MANINDIALSSNINVIKSDAYENVRSAMMFPTGRCMVSEYCSRNLMYTRTDFPMIVGSGEIYCRRDRIMW